MKHSHNYLSLFMTFCVVVFISNVAYAQRPTRSAINLGLSVKWANMNIGADSPEEYGNYYAWGETDTKRYYGIYSTYRNVDEKVWHNALRNARRYPKWKRRLENASGKTENEGLFNEIGRRGSPFCR